MLRGRAQIAQKKMFGGLVFLLRGNMLVCIWQQALIVRLGPEAAAAALRLPEVREFDVTGKPMKGWVLVTADGLETDRQLSDWIEQALRFVDPLPGK